ncbi:hypothetical protein D3C81_1216080 [compost metagenome]
MVEVDVQDGYSFCTPVEAALSSDCRVVEIAVPAHVLTSRMVPWRSAQSESTSLAINDPLDAGQGDIRAAAHGFPRT